MRPDAGAPPVNFVKRQGTLVTKQFPTRLLWTKIDDKLEARAFVWIPGPAMPCKDELPQMPNARIVRFQNEPPSGLGRIDLPRRFYNVLNEPCVVRIIIVEFCQVLLCLCTTQKFAFDVIEVILLQKSSRDPFARIPCILRFPNLHRPYAQVHIQLASHGPSELRRITVKGAKTPKQPFNQFNNSPTNHHPTSRRPVLDTGLGYLSTSPSRASTAGYHWSHRSSQSGFSASTSANFHSRRHFLTSFSRAIAGSISSCRSA
jgi:hypothetical protein